MVQKVSDKQLIYYFSKKDIYLFAYHIGDLDDFFFHNCTWYGLFDNDQLTELILLFSGLSTPTLLVFGFSKISMLLDEIIDDLPDRFYCHYTKGLEKNFLSKYEMDYFGTHLKMKYQGLPKELRVKKFSNCTQLTEKQTGEILTFYEKSYPNTYFESFMLKTGKYYGIIENNLIKSIAGVHVYSKKYNIAVLGNIATDLSSRGLGYATTCVITLLQSLEAEIKHIGLNVKVDNIAALKLYQKTGFVPHLEYEEAFFKKKQYF
ncbi:MAG: GNAT family N-acetyltransferase [Candidatus Hodarchaeota archaeon]